jgi:hypothetical protein
MHLVISLLTRMTFLSNGLTDAEPAYRDGLYQIGADRAPVIIKFLNALALFSLQGDNQLQRSSSLLPDRCVEATTREVPVK